LASPPNCITAKVMCSCNEALFTQSDYSSVRIWRFQPLHLQLAGMLKQMLGEIGRTWSSEGSWRRRHVINAGSFIFVPIIEWKSRACILMPSSDDKSVVLSWLGSNKLTYVLLTVMPIYPPLTWKTDTVNLYLHVLAVLVGPISLQEVKNNKYRIQAYRHWYCVQWNFKKVYAGKLKRFPYLICQVPPNQEWGYATCP
jgi:hypothetical protein